MVPEPSFDMQRTEGSMSYDIRVREIRAGTYRNRRQRWCKKEENKVLGEGNETKILLLKKPMLKILFHFSLSHHDFIASYENKRKDKESRGRT